MATTAIAIAIEARYGGQLGASVPGENGRYRAKFPLEEAVKIDF